MSFINRQSKTVVTAVGGAATEYVSGVEGMLERIRYVKASSGGYADGVDMTITEEDTGITLLTKTDANASFTSYPRAPTNDTADAASLYAAAGEPVETRIPIKGRIKIVLAQGGDAKTGQFIFDLS